MSSPSTYPHIAGQRAEEWRKNPLWAPGTKWNPHSAIPVQEHHPGLSQRVMKTESCCCCAQLTWEEKRHTMGHSRKLKQESRLGGKRTYHHFHQMRFSQNASGVGVPLWPLLTSGSWGCFHCCGCWQMREVETVSGPPSRCESTLHKTQLKKNKEINKIKVNKVHIDIARESWYWPTHCGSGVLQRGIVALTQVATSWPRTWKPGSQWKCAWPPGWMSVTVTPPFSGDRGKGQDSRYAVDIET